MIKIVPIAAAIVCAVGAAAAAHATSVAHAVQDEGLKQKICEAVGCPDTSDRLCAEVSGEVDFPFFKGTVSYKCYEPEL